MEKYLVIGSNNLFVNMFDSNVYFYNLNLLKPMQSYICQSKRKNNIIKDLSSATLKDFTHIIIDINAARERFAFKRDFTKFFKNIDKSSKVILISSLDVYDETSSIFINENTLIENNKFYYTGSLYEIEKEFLRYDFTKMILRLPLLLGDDLEGLYPEKLFSSILSGNIYVPRNIFAFNFISTHVLKDIINTSFSKIKDNNNEIINVSDSKNVSIKKTIKMIIKEVGLEDLYNKYPQKIDCSSKLRKRVSNKKLYKKLGIKINTDIRSSIRETYVWYKNHHLLNQKLTPEIKKTISSFSKSIDLYEYMGKYQENQLTNLAIMDYFFTYLSNNSLSKERKDFLNNMNPADREKEFKYWLKLLDAFKNAEVKEKINGVKYKTISKRKAREFKTTETELTLYDESRLKKELEYINKNLL